MASSVPCQICEAIGENVLSQFLVKPLEDVGGMPEGVTVWLCQNHLVTVVLGWFDQPAEGTDPADMTNAEYYGALDHGDDPTGAGVLEQIEADEGQVEPARSNGRGSKRKTPSQESAAAEEVSEATAAADVAE